MLLTVQNIHKTFQKKRLKVLEDVSFALERGRTLGVVGRSGSGKSTLGKIILGLVKPDEGQVLYSGKRMGAIFQNPFSSLDPLMRVREALQEPLLIEGKKDRGFLESASERLLAQVGLPARFASKRPAELSGGECQRVAIARAIALDPELIVCDEPTSSLDRVTQSQILELLLKLQREKHTSYIFITHDLEIVRHMGAELLSLQSHPLQV